MPASPDPRNTFEVTVPPYFGQDLEVAPFRCSDVPFRCSVRFTCYNLYYCTIYITVCASVREICIILYTKGTTIPMALAPCGVSWDI
jgi:hypothetical protein